MINLNQELEKATKQVRTNELDDAIETLKAILEQDARHEIAMGMLASINLQIGRTKQAIALFEKLLSINPSNPLARFQLGLAQLNRGEPQTALDVWQPMLDDENEFMANFHSALAALQLDQRENATAFLERARQHMPVEHPLYAQLFNLHSKLTQRTA